MAVRERAAHVAQVAVRLPRAFLRSAVSPVGRPQGPEPWLPAGFTIVRNLEQQISSNLGPDKALVERARGGDREAFDALIVRYQDRVYNMSFRMLGNREDALDAAQEVFLTVFRSLATFQSKARFSTWLYRVTVNRCRDELRPELARPLERL